MRATLRTVAVVLACLGAGLARGDAADANSAAALRARYRGLQNQLAGNPFQRPLYLESSETADGVTGNIHALVNYPFAIAGAALNSPAAWCDILLPHLNTKYCRAATDSHGGALRVYIGKKHEQPLDDAYRVDFAYRVAAGSADYLRVALSRVPSRGLVSAATGAP